MKTKEDILAYYKLKDKIMNSYMKHHYPNIEDLIEISMNEMRNEIINLIRCGEYEVGREGLIKEIKNIEIK